MKAIFLPLVALLLTASPSFLQPQRNLTPNLFPVVGNARYGFIDRTGRVVIEPQFRGQYFIGFSEGLAYVWRAKGNASRLIK
jgi:hypothetical protein